MIDITITNNIIINGKNIIISKVLLVIIFIAWVAGNILPAASNDFGSIFVGNMIPDSINEGKKINWENIVIFEGLFTSSPSNVPIDKETIIKIINVKKYSGIFEGIGASKAIGAIKNIIKLTMKRFIKAEIKLLIAGIDKGIFEALYAFFISLPYKSTSGTGVPSIAPIVIENIDIDWINVSFEWGLIDEKIDPMKPKNISGTI